MKEFYALISIIFLTFSTVFSSESVGNFSHSNYPGQCYLSDNEIYKPGIHKKKDYCIEVLCENDGWVIMTGCIAAEFVNDQGPCTEGDYIDINATYPECCKKYWHCKDVNGNEYVEIQ